MDPQSLAQMLGYGDPVNVDPLAQVPVEDPNAFAAPGTTVQPPIVDPALAAGVDAFLAPEADPWANAAPAPGSEPGLVDNLKSFGVSMQEKGFSPTQHKAINKAAPHSRTDKAYAKGAQQAQGIFGPLLEGHAAVAGQERAAVDALADAETEKIKLQAQHALDIKNEQLKLMQDVEVLQAKNMLKSQEDKARYMASLEAIPMVNPNQLFDHAGKAGQFGMAIAAFVHDFLGAKGIKTSAMDTINGAIQRNMQSQLENIRTKKHVAQGFKDVWEMTRAESASEAEAMTRMHGYYLKAFEAGLDAEMGKIDAGIAQAKRQAAKVMVNKALLDVQAKVAQFIDQAGQQAAQREVTMRGQDLNYSMAAKRLAFDKAVKDAEAKAAAAKTAPVIPVYDTSESGQNIPKWKIKSVYAGNKEITENIPVKINSTAKAIAGMRKLEQLQAKLDGSAPQAAGRIRNEMDRLETALRTDVVWALVIDSAGKRATDADFKNIEKLVPADDWFTNGNNRKIIANLLESKRTETQAAITQFTDDMTPEEIEANPAAKNEFAGAEGVEARLQISGDDKPQITPTNKATEWVTRKDALDTKPPAELLEHTQIKTKDGISTLSDRYKEFEAKFPEASPIDKGPHPATKSTGLFKGKDGNLVDFQGNPAKEPGITRKAGEPSAAFAAFDVYRQKAAEGDKSALTELVNWADLIADVTGDGDVNPIAPDGSDPNDDNTIRKAYMAHWHLEKLRADGVNFKVNNDGGDISYDFTE